MLPRVLCVLSLVKCFAAFHQEVGLKCCKIFPWKCSWGRCKDWVVILWLPSESCLLSAASTQSCHAPLLSKVGCVWKPHEQRKCWLGGPGWPELQIKTLPQKCSSRLQLPPAWAVMGKREGGNLGASPVGAIPVGASARACSHFG